MNTYSHELTNRIVDALTAAGIPAEREKDGQETDSSSFVIAGIPLLSFYARQERGRIEVGAHLCRYTCEDQAPEFYQWQDGSKIEAPRVGFSADRDNAAIAKEIERRLLPAAHEYAAGATRFIAIREEARAKRSAARERLEAVGGTTAPSDLNRVDGSARQNDGSAIYWDATINWSGSVNFTARSADADAVADCINALKIVR